MIARSNDSGNSALKAWVRALAMTAPIPLNPQATLPTQVDALAEKFGTAPALIGDDETLTYRLLAERANRYARWALEHAPGAKSTTCLMLANCPDYLAVWLGITRTGGIAALLNTQLVGDSLAHAINVANPDQIIVGAEFADALVAVRPRLKADLTCWVHGAHHAGLQRIDTALRGISGEPLSDLQCPRPSITDRALYIYTSGTTGWPKAANVSHYRVMQWTHWFAGMLDISSTDRMYNCLPMYHSVGGVVAVGATLINGGSVVLRREFSARRFWDDVVAMQCTLFQYIGELCRLLLKAASDRQQPEHRIRLCCGNGLSHDIWEAFQERFRIPRILEFYAATEANFSLYNCEGKPGSVGRIPSFLAHRFPVALVRFDVESGEPARNHAGFCERCSTDEVGEAISAISRDATDAGGRFEGYTDTAASGAKVLHDVFTIGDAWFRSGDLMRRDGAGFYYFIDRIGDTFRWKGENVATSEVAAALQSCAGIVDALVYGVSVPGIDGRAGMAAITVDSDFEIDNLERHLIDRLPEFARPVFLRILGEMELTTTFKPKKQPLIDAGINCTDSVDRLYVRDRASGSYLNLDAALKERIEAGNFRL